jgi:hypothetical protein
VSESLNRSIEPQRTQRTWSVGKCGVRRIAVICLVLLLLAGCSASRPTLGRWEGPAHPAGVTTSAWSWVERPGRTIHTDNYDIHTTIDDPETVNYLAQIMQGAYAMYRQAAPEVVPSSKPMECFIFQMRSEWEQYTMRFAGPDANVYIQIRNGGYTQKDRYVSFYNGRLSTYSVASHEGWHQFAGRNFTGRLPPFLEEGMACRFETINWENDLPRWNLSVNSERLLQLRQAIEHGNVVPLEKLCTMHAGDVVGESSDKIDAFYAQSWAFARFLWEGENARFRPALQRWIAETANGTVLDPTGSHRVSSAPWRREGVGAMIEHYLGTNLAEVSRLYQVWLKHVAYEESNLHW